MKNTKEEIIHSLNTIFSNKKMIAEFNAKYNIEKDAIITAVKCEIITDEVLTLIQSIAPICYKIRDKVFLKCSETVDTIDLIGDSMDYHRMTQLMDITTEIKTGESNSFYTSSLEYFEFASSNEIINVRKFLKSLF